MSDFTPGLETDSGKGSDKIASAIMDFLNRIRKRCVRWKYSNLHLYCDSCPAQNKNSTVMAALLMFVNSPRNPFQSVKVVFPIRGHSYLPPDQVFGRVEKVYRRQELIKMPDSYVSILEKHGAVRMMYNHWKPYDFKTLVSNHFIKQKVPIMSTKIWIFKQNQPYVWFQEQYSSLAVRYNILKRGSKALHTLRPKLLPPVSHLSVEKRNDVMKLLSFINLDPEEEEKWSKLLEKIRETKRKRNVVRPVLIKK